MCSTCMQMLAQNSTALQSQQGQQGLQHYDMSKLHDAGVLTNYSDALRAPHVHEWEPCFGPSESDALRCSCGSVVSGRVKREERPAENCIRCVDLERQVRDEAACNEPLRKLVKLNEEMEQRREKVVADLRAELARTKDALAEAVMQRRGKR